MIQHTIALDELFDRLNWRYATKKFDSNRVIPDNIWHVLEQSLVLSPSSFGLQPWAFFVIRNRDIRAQLVNHAFGQKAVADASHLIVLA
ncbi:MAG: nitroreductase family protein, partial [Cyanobacteria bacterium P01_G01_bin.4]